MIFAQWLPSERYGTEKMGAHLIKFSHITGPINQPRIPSSGVFVRSLKRSRLRLISIRASCVITRLWRVNQLRQHQMSVIFLTNRTDFYTISSVSLPELCSLYFRGYHSYHILNMYVHACRKILLCSLFAFHLFFFKRQNAEYSPWALTSILLLCQI